jgi:hypothetical protein
VTGANLTGLEMAIKVRDLLESVVRDTSIRQASIFESNQSGTS